MIMSVYMTVQEISYNTAIMIIRKILQNVYICDMHRSHYLHNQYCIPHEEGNTRALSTSDESGRKGWPLGCCLRLPLIVIRQRLLVPCIGLPLISIVRAKNKSQLRFWCVYIYIYTHTIEHFQGFGNTAQLIHNPLVYQSLPVLSQKICLITP